MPDAKAVERARLWRLANPERSRESQAQYRERHKDDINQRARNKHADNRDEDNQRRRAQRLEFPSCDPTKRRADYAADVGSRRTKQSEAWMNATEEQKETARERSKQRTPEARYVEGLKRNYGLSLEEYQALSDKQGGKCALCGEIPSHKLRVDHNHETGEVRGLLCQKCNTALGQFNDDSNRLYQAAEYLGGLYVELLY